MRSSLPPGRNIGNMRICVCALRPSIKSTNCAVLIVQPTDVVLWQSRIYITMHVKTVRRVFKESPMGVLYRIRPQKPPSSLPLLLICDMHPVQLLRMLGGRLLQGLRDSFPWSSTSQHGSISASESEPSHHVSLERVPYSARRSGPNVSTRPLEPNPSNSSI